MLEEVVERWISWREVDRARSLKIGKCEIKNVEKSGKEDGMKREKVRIKREKD